MKLPHSKVLLLYLVGFFDIFACGMFATNLSLVARNFGASPIGLGVFGSLYGVLQLFSSPICGDLADTRGRKRVLCWCLFLTAFGYLALGISGTFLALLVSRIPSSLFKHTQTLLRALLVTNVERQDQTRVLGYYSAATAFGFVFAPTLGGYIIDSFGFAILMSCVAGIFFFNMLLVAYLVDEQSVRSVSPQPAKIDGKSDTPSRSAMQSLHDVTNFVRSLSTEAALVFVVKFSMTASVILYRSNLSVVLDEKFSLSGAQLGAVIGYTALIGSIGGCFIDSLIRKIGGGSIHRVLLAVSIGQLLSILLASLATDLHAFVLAQSPLTFCNLVSSVVLSKVLLDSVDKSSNDSSSEQAAANSNGLVFGTSQSVVGLARLICPFVAGVLLGVHTNAPGLCGALFSAVAVACSVALLRISHRRKKQN